MDYRPFTQSDRFRPDLIDRLNAILAELYASRLSPGPGIRIDRTPAGITVAADAADSLSRGQGYDGLLAVRFDPAATQFYVVDPVHPNSDIAGYCRVNGILRYVSSSSRAAAAEGWLCLSSHLEDTQGRLEIVQRLSDRTVGDTTSKGYYPLADVWRETDGTWRWRQVTKYVIPEIEIYYDCPANGGQQA